MLVARHPNRPTVLDYVNRLFTDFTEISGDRRFADDHAIVTGFARYKGEHVLVVGHHKGGGGDTKQKIFRNFGYAKPEGYRKALRAMKLAEKFSRPVLAFIDTPAAYPGIESEERGISEAIALNLREMAALDTPIVVVVHGEGGSGGALGIAVGDRILMHEFAIYSVIPPEGCAAILWRDAGRKVEAADALKLTAPDLLGLGIIDEIVPEPTGGAHTNHELAATLLDVALVAGAGRGVGDGARRPASTRGTASGARWATSALIEELMRCGHDAPDLGARAVRRAAGATRSSASSRHRRCTARLLCIRGLGDLETARRFLSPSLDDLHDPFALADMARGGRPHPRRDRAQGAHRRARRLRRGRRHLDGHPAPRARAARRRRHPLHPRAAARRLRPAAGVARSAARRRRARWSSRWTAASAASKRRGTRARSAST